MTSGSYEKHPQNYYLRHTIATQIRSRSFTKRWTYQNVFCRLLGHTKTVVLHSARVHAAAFVPKLCISFPFWEPSSYLMGPSASSTARQSRSSTAWICVNVGLRRRCRYRGGLLIGRHLQDPTPSLSFLTSPFSTFHIMQYLSLLALVGAATAQGLSKGFNYGNVFTDGSPKQQADFEAEFNRAKTLPNTSGFSSARLYTMIQGGTANTPISAIQAAIDTQTSLLLGLWASASSDVFQNELDALRTAIEQYGTAFTDLIVGISVGSEDLCRISVQGILNESGLGEGPDVLVDYIQRTRSVIAGTAASAASVGHVDTWNDWVNGSNSAVIEAVDWIGFNGEFTRNINYSVQHTNKS